MTARRRQTESERGVKQASKPTTNEEVISFAKFSQIFLTESQGFLLTS
jgi:hypothetical protein